MTEPQRRIVGSAMVAGLALVLAACATSGPGADPETDGPAASPPAATAVATPGQAETEPPGGEQGVDLEVVTSGLQQPVAVAMPDDGSGDLYVVEQAGRIVRLPGGAEPSVEALDITDQVGSGGERGLLGLAFSPSVADDGRLFVDYTDDNGDTVIAEFRRRDDGSIDPDSERVVLQLSQPAANHNGGDVHFGPDGMLYIAFGDGGGGNSQNGGRMDTLLGKILRLDVLGEPDAGLAYAVPPDNPFVGQAGVRPEIWATGLRNPWRFSIEPGSGALWIGDVGAGSREEIDYAPQGGLDFGWDRVEGTLCRDEAVCQDPDLVAPVAEYGHDQGCVVTGGLVYQGSAIDSLGGRYVLADYCSGVIGTLDALLGYGSVQAIEPLLETGLAIVAFGQDADGEVLVVDHGGSLQRLVAAP
jgi:glucose/arabinose dehydrogenase